MARQRIGCVASSNGTNTKYSHTRVFRTYGASTYDQRELVHELNDQRERMKYDGQDNRKIKYSLFGNEIISKFTEELRQSLTMANINFTIAI